MLITSVSQKLHLTATRASLLLPTFGAGVNLVKFSVPRAQISEFVKFLAIFSFLYFGGMSYVIRAGRLLNLSKKSCTYWNAFQRSESKVHHHWNLQYQHQSGSKFRRCFHGSIQDKKVLLWDEPHFFSFQAACENGLWHWRLDFDKKYNRGIQQTNDYHLEVRWTNCPRKNSSETSSNSDELTCFSFPFPVWRFAIARGTCFWFRSSNTSRNSGIAQS